MPRKKTIKTIPVTELNTNLDSSQEATKEAAEQLAEMFNQFAVEKFGTLNPPEAFITPSGIKPLDALLGGGFVSSAPICFSSTPESGKSTISFQMCKRFLDTYPAAIAVYCDVESISDVESADNNQQVFHESRPHTFGLDIDKRFIYCRRPFTIKDFFEYINSIL